MEKRPAPKGAWKKGQSGNPAGKRAGTRNKATLMIMALMESGAKDIVKQVIEAAKGGDMRAARLVIERLAPPARERLITFETLPGTEDAAGVAEAQAAILQAVAAGELTPGEAATLSGIVENRRKAIETQELEQRIQALEEQQK